MNLWNATTGLTDMDPGYSLGDAHFDPANNYSVSNNSFLEFLTTMTAPHRKQYHRRQPPTTEFLDTLGDYVMPVAICIGIVGNMLLFTVFVYTPIRASALSHYLAAMGVSDFLYLVSCLIVWIAGRTIGVCQLSNFILRLSRFLAAWYLFAAHVERLIVHLGSPRAAAWCSTFRTKFIIVFIFVFSMVGFLHYIWTHVVMERGGRHMCVIMPESIKHIKQLGNIELIAGSFLPMYLIFVIDIVLCIHAIIKGCRSYLRIRSKKGYMKTTPGKDEMGDYVLASNHRSRSPSNRSGNSTPPPPEFDLSLERVSATVTVVIAGLIFIGLLLPSSVYQARHYFGPKTRGVSRQDMLSMRLFQQLVKFNSVYKFILYIILLRSFRHGVFHLFTCRRKKQIQENSLQESTEV